MADIFTTIGRSLEDAKMQKSGIWAKVSSIFGAGCILLMCAFSCNKVDQQTESVIESTKITPCPPIPKTFKEADLSGTWVAHYGLNDTDTLILQDDGLYKQTYIGSDGVQSYESNWREWQIEYRESGYIRLHLKGMRRAGELSSIFDRESGGVDPKLFRAIDYCEGSIVEMPDEVVLIVTGASYDTPRGILLRQTRLSGSDWSWYFSLSIK